VKINRQNKNSKEISVTYADDDTININIFDNQILMGVVGIFDNNLKELERFTGSKIYFRGNSITIKGKKFENERVKGAIEYLIGRFRFDKKIDRNDIISSLNKSKWCYFNSARFNFSLNFIIVQQIIEGIV